jgi:hypothetical protein
VAVGSVLGLPSETSGARGHGAGHKIQVVPSLRLGLARRPGPDALPFPLAEDTLRLHPGIGAAIVAGGRALGMSAGDDVLVPAYHSTGQVDALLGAGLHARRTASPTAWSRTPPTSTALSGACERCTSCITTASHR